MPHDKNALLVADSFPNADDAYDDDGNDEENFSLRYVQANTGAHSSRNSNMSSWNAGCHY